MNLLKRLQLSLGGIKPHVHDAPIIRLRDVSVEFENGFALENISFELTRGDRVSVVGPNGAGKTTLFKLLSGVLKPTHGTVEIFGHEPQGHICIGYVPQRSQIDWNFPVTVSDMVMMGRVSKIGPLRRPHAKDWEHVNTALARVNLSELSQRRINQLSGGQQQRIFIARALAQEAELLLLDEPLTGLDANAQRDLYPILDSLSTIGVTIILSLHDLHIAAERCDTMILLNRRILAMGSPKNVLTSQNLMAAYGSHLHLVPAEGGMIAVEDTYCEGDEPR